MSLWKSLRILILLLILGFVALNELLVKQRSMDWTRPMLVVIYPLNGDGDPRTQQYIDKLDSEDFKDIQEFVARESLRYGQPADRYFHIDVSHNLKKHPPQPPRSKDRSVWEIGFWSLSFRWFAWHQDNYDEGNPDIQMFVTYYHPDNVKSVPHSLGLQKGMIGAVHAFAHKKVHKQNNVVIAHEMFHTLGASDKYDAETNEPLYPIGYAEPDATPLLPQRYAELMGGRIPIAVGKAVMPKSLRYVRIGEASALEVGLKPL